MTTTAPRRPKHRARTTLRTHVRELAARWQVTR
jgi:hypothetical protein